MSVYECSVIVILSRGQLKRRLELPLSGSGFYQARTENGKPRIRTTLDLLFVHKGSAPVKAVFPSHSNDGSLD